MYSRLLLKMAHHIRTCSQTETLQIKKIYRYGCGVKYVYEGHRVKVMVTQAIKRPMLSCLSNASDRAWLQLHCVVKERHINMMTGNSMCHICAA